MSQQINLFNPIFLKQKKYFSALTMVQALAAILVGCVLLIIYAEFQVSRHAKDAAAAAAQLAKTQEQLLAVTAQFSPRPNNLALDGHIKKTETNIQSMQRVFDALQSGEFGDTNGYSPYFRAFSRQIINGLWLTGIGIHGAGHEINLKGRALNAALVPQYLTRLKREPEMKGKSFSELAISEPQVDTSGGATGSDGKTATTSTRTRYVEFDLESSEATDSGAPAEGAVK